jgi:predicted TIM-barrel fold metal-dependent hydrolase
MRIIPSERSSMLNMPKCPVIALEEHYWDKELAAQFVGGEGVRDAEMLKRLYDLGELRLREMDEAGIDMQILSHGAPSAQKLSGADAVALTRRVNDRLHAAVNANPSASARSRRCRPAIPRRRPMSSSAPPSLVSRDR